jgi:predicted transposase/invertase (TIGR01784 family)
MNIRTDKYINPLTDFGFKKLFGSEPNKSLLIDFLNQILPNRIIKDLSYASTEKLGQTLVDRKAIFDLYCIGENGERFIVEMQKAKQNYFKDRSVFYASFPIQEQAKKNKWNYRLEPVYSIGILDFIFEDHQSDDELLHIVELKNQKGEVFYDKLKFIYLELPKFTKKESELKTHFDKWLYVFTHLSELQNRPESLQERIFKKLFETAEIAKFSLKEKVAYEESLKYYRDIKNVVDTSREEGILEGKIEGKIEGILEGEIKEKEKTALNCINQGLDNSLIAKITGLNEERIQEMRNK